MSELFDMPTGWELRPSAMAVRTLPWATPKALERARRTWPEARAQDFEVEGKRFRDKATGRVYRRVPGDPGLGGVAREDVDTWYVSHDEAGDGIVFLRAEDNAGSATSVLQGEIGGRPAAPHEAVAR